MIVNPSGGTQRGWAILKSIELIFTAANTQHDAHVTTQAGLAGNDIAHRAADLTAAQAKVTQ